MFGLIGVASAILYLAFRVFAEFATGSIGIIIFALILIYKLKAKFKPDSYLFELQNEKIIVWRRSEFKNDEPHLKEVVSFERSNNGLLLTVKELGVSSLKTKLSFDDKDFGSENLSLLNEYLISLNSSGSTVIDKHVKVAYKPKPIPVETAGYLTTLIVFFCLNVALNEDPNKYTFMNGIISPVDFEVTLRDNSFAKQGEEDITSFSQCIRS